MAKRKLAVIGLNQLNKELQMELLRQGREITEALAQKIADKANTIAPVIKGEAPSNFEKPLRRGPDKSGSSSSGPIKGNVYVHEGTTIPDSWLVTSPAWYSHFVEFGTKAHEMPSISYKTGKKMVFPGTKNFSGKVVATKKVKHPGVKGKGRKPFLRPAADKAEEFLHEILGGQ